ncbi:MAG: hypothetical protein JST22_03080 [Bacteroidetes bacterium]|nr:hypothetical protein [Bacteroidota bacterium]
MFENATGQNGGGAAARFWATKVIETAIYGGAAKVAAARPVAPTTAAEATPAAEPAAPAEAAAQKTAQTTPAEQPAAKASGAVDPNKLHHIFGKSQHNLGKLVSEFGSEAKAFEAMQRAAEVVVKQKGITGVFEEVVQVGAQKITIRGNVVNGAVKIGTAFK